MEHPEPLCHAQAKAGQDAANAAAEESGEDITVDMRPFQWRYCALGLSMQVGFPW